MLPLADGSDYGGSLRNPANFNGIVALRPSGGARLQSSRSSRNAERDGSSRAALVDEEWLGLNVKGPMARTVDDVNFLFSVMLGLHDPWPLTKDLRGTRVAWCPNLGGLPLDPRVRAVLDSRRRAFEDLGCVVENAGPDLADADGIFLTTRRRRSFMKLGAELKDHRAQMKPEAIDEIERGSKVTDAQLADAVARHGRLLQRVHAFFETHDFLVCAVNQVPPFDAEIDWPKEIDGV
jgi:amidase